MHGVSLKLSKNIFPIRLVSLMTLNHTLVLKLIIIPVSLKDIGNMNSIDDLRNWMIMEKLMINDDKTKTKFFVCSFTDGKYDIDPALCVRSRQVVCLFINTKFCNAAFYYFHNKY